jgi:hypothetical protein
MMIPLLLLVAGRLAAQDVFSANDGEKPFVKRDPCQERRSRNCGTIYYNPNDANGRDSAARECERFIKQCAKPGGGCDCWTMPDRPLSMTPAQRRPQPNQTPAASAPTPRPRNQPLPADLFNVGPPPPGQRVEPGELGPRLTAEVQNGRCQMATHNGKGTYLNCPGHLPDLINDRLQKDPTAPDPAKPAPIRLYGSVSQSEGPATGTGTGHASRFGVGNINEADPPLLVTAKVLQGIDDCLKENLISDIAMLPLGYASQRYRGLKSLMAGFGMVGSVGTLVHDLQETLVPGQSLGDAAYEVGRLLCEGYTLKDAMKLGKAESPGLDPVRPVAKPTPAYKDPNVRSALERGIPLVDHKALQAMAQDKGWNIIVRDSNPAAMKWVGHPDAVAKPVDVKAKTLKPPTWEQATRMSPAEKAQERQNAPYYGLASAKGMTSGELSLLRLKGYTVDDPTKGYLLRTPEGKVMYSDIDIHGIYDRAGNDMWPKTPEGERAMLEEMNDSTLERMFQHGPQDNYARRNDPTGPSYGAQPPATVYTHDGRNLFLDSVSAMEAAYREMGIAWESIYTRPAGGNR